MNILHIIYSLDTGGAQRLVADLARALAKIPDCRVTVLTYIPAPDSEIEKMVKDNPDIKFECLGLNTDKHPAIPFRLRKYLRNADVAHVHLFPSIYLAAFANIGINTPLIYTEHSTHNRRRDIPLLRYPEKWAYSNYKAIGCISDAVKNNLTDWIGSALSPRLYVIPNGIDLTRFNNIEKQNPKRIFGRDGIPLLMVSRFTPAKDQPTLIRALKYLPEDVFAVFAGAGSTLAECKKIAEEEGLSGRTIFLGDCSDISPLLSAASVGVQASKWEGFGLTAVEMMASALPVVASDVEGLNRVVKDAGLIYSPGNPESLASKISLLLKDKKLRENCVSAGLKRAEQYDMRHTAHAYMRLYKSFLR